MPRPRKWRRVCCLPKSNRFGPLNQESKNSDIINMSIDEYETIRLIDLENLTQEECATQMNIARTTVQGIYNGARKKLAQSLVNGNEVYINGGDYQLYEGEGKYCHSMKCRHQYGKCQKGEIL